MDGELNVSHAAGIEAGSAAYDLTRRTPAEELRLWRYRQFSSSGKLKGRSGPYYSRGEAAIALGLNHLTYLNLETNGDARLMLEQTSVLAEIIDNPPKPTTGELCRLARWRAGNAGGRPVNGAVVIISLTELTTALAMSRPTFYVAERAGDPKIIDFWQNRGFTFTV